MFRIDNFHLISGMQRYSNANSAPYLVVHFNEKSFAAELDYLADFAGHAHCAILDGPVHRLYGIPIGHGGQSR